MLKGKTIIVGVCGGIAAYKVVDAVSRLVKLGADVHVIMTAHAEEFVTPLTFQSISKNLVVTDMFAEPKSWDIRHISLAEKVDLVLVAPATANVIGKIAAGIADDMLTTVILATKAPVMFIPAMNTGMFENPVFQRNMQLLGSLGYQFMDPETGVMACGTSGKGRLPEPRCIAEQVCAFLQARQDLQGKRVLITAGPTREPIDPVRYISNHSSGKMGYAIAEAAAARGAEVVLISGPVALQAPGNIQVERVVTAEEMLEKAVKHYENCDVAIMAAAVADYRCAEVQSHKIKKDSSEMVLELVRNPDIAKELGLRKQKQVNIGFSAETDQLEMHALQKLKAKNFDMIVANDVTMEGAGFHTDTNIVKLIRGEGDIQSLPLMSKRDVAHRILDEVVSLIFNL